MSIGVPSTFATLACASPSTMVTSLSTAAPFDCPVDDLRKMAIHRRKRSPAYLKALLLLAAAFSAPVTGAQPEMKWWYREPAARYWEGLPLSNGRLAAMVYGRTRDELIPLNDESLWSGAPYNPNNPEGRDALPEIRRLLLAGEYVKAQALCEKLLSRPRSVQHYQPLGELRMRFEGADGAAAYRRELDMDSAIARVTYIAGGVRFTRDVFASYPDQVLVVRVTADKPGSVSFAARLASIQPSARSTNSGGDGIEMAGMAQSVTAGASANPMIPAKTRWCARLRVVPEGGTWLRAESRPMRTVPPPASEFPERMPRP
jgi:alpha-L-fucosidase 2